jgi:hypothetical protein
LFLIGLSRSHDLDREFSRLIYVENWIFFTFYEVILVSWPESRVWHVNLGILLFNFFQSHSLTLSWLGIEFHNLFWFFLYGVIMVSWSRSWIWRVNMRVGPDQSDMLLFQCYLIKKMLSWIFINQTMFLLIVKLRLDPSSQSGHIKSISTWFKKLLEKY